MRDLRNSLPTCAEADYDTRSLDAITGVTLHYTEGPASQTAEEVAAWQTSDDARSHTGNGTPFPGIAYTVLVEESGVPGLCWDLDVRTWHSAAVVDGEPRNLTHVGICYTGDLEPNPAQILGLVEAIRWCQDQLGRQLTIEGHRDAPYDTSCPGEAWPAWRADLESALV